MIRERDADSLEKSRIRFPDLNPGTAEKIAVTSNQKPTEAAFAQVLTLNLKTHRVTKVAPAPKSEAAKSAVPSVQRTWPKRQGWIDETDHGSKRDRPFQNGRPEITAPNRPYANLFLPESERPMYIPAPAPASSAPLLNVQNKMSKTDGNNRKAAKAKRVPGAAPQGSSKDLEN